MANFTKSRCYTRIGALSAMDRTLSELGVDPEPLLAAHGLTTQMLADGDQLIPLEQAARLMEHAVRATGCGHFALELAARQDVNLLGAVGLLLQTADTVKTALQDVERYLRMTHVTHIHWLLVRHLELDAFEVSLEIPHVTSHQARIIIELAVAQCYRVLRSVSGDRLSIAGICFRHGDINSLPALRRFFGAPVQVTADIDGLLFSPGVLDLPIARADHRMHDSVRRLLLGRQANLPPDSTAEQVRVLIRSLLPTGHCNIERIARCFACDKRTLQRYLREDSDTNYQQLLDEVRYETACYYLRESNLPVTQLAQLAGFAEPTNFARAFRRRFGQSPREWRNIYSDNRRPNRLNQRNRQ